MMIVMMMDSRHCHDRDGDAGGDLRAMVLAIIAARGFHEGMLSPSRIRVTGTVTAVTTMKIISMLLLSSSAYY